MSEIRAFAPMYTPGAGNAVGTLAASTTIAATVAAAPTTIFAGTMTNYQQQIRVANQTSAWAFMNFGVFGNITAATVAASLPVAPGAVEVFTVDKEVSGASVILAAGGTTGNVTFTRGEGL